MPRSTPPLETDAGKLVAATQKKWHNEVEEPQSAESKDVMHAAHKLLQAASKFELIVSVIGSTSVSAFLGEQWVQANPSVLPYIALLEDTA